MCIKTKSKTSLDKAVLYEEKKYADANVKSRDMFSAAAACLPGGNTRAALYYDPFPLFFEKAFASCVKDVDGHIYIDMSNDMSAGLYGHSDPIIVDALKQGLDFGMSFGATHETEVKFAAEICSRYASFDRIRFCTSGTEACLGALKIAQAITGRRHILAFHGGYHGNVMNYLSPDAPLNVDHQDLLIAHFNDLNDVDAITDQYKGSIAAIIVEPIMGSGGGIIGDSDFLKSLREVADRIGALLIFDEIQTARFAIGGYQSIVDVQPDMTTIGKFFGGGLNFGAIGGSAEIMDRLSPLASKKLMHSGTFNNNILTMIAGYTALTKIFTQENLERLHVLSQELRNSMQDSAARHSVPFLTGSYSSLISTHFQNKLPQNPEEINTPPMFRKLMQLYMINHGIFLSRRCQYTLSFANTVEEYSVIADRFDQFLDVYGHLVDRDN